MENGQKTEKPLWKVSSDQQFDYYERRILVDKQSRSVIISHGKGKRFLLLQPLRSRGYGAGLLQFPDYTWFSCTGLGQRRGGSIRFSWTGSAMEIRANDVETDEYIYIGQPVTKIANWNQNPSAMDVRCFYGGDLQGVWEKLDYLQNLGVEVSYFNPMFVSIQS